MGTTPTVWRMTLRCGLDRRAASTRRMGRFETGWRTCTASLAALADLSPAWIDRAHARCPGSVIMRGMASSVGETHGAQQDSAWNGHFGCTGTRWRSTWRISAAPSRCPKRSGIGR
jgi:hypothetical protein